MVQPAIQQAENVDSFKEVMISFVCKSLGLTEREETSLLQSTRDLSQNSTLPDLIEHLQDKNLELELIEKIKEFGKDN
jgi:hypothetical protein